MLPSTHMVYTELTEEQKTRILTQSLLTTNLKELDMRGNGGLEAELCRKAKQVIKELDVSA